MNHCKSLAKVSISFAEVNHCKTLQAGGGISLAEMNHCKSQTRAVFCLLRQLLADDNLPEESS